MIVEKEFKAETESLNEIQDFICETAEKSDIPANIVTKLNICTDEIVSNIIKYSSAEYVSLKMATSGESPVCTITYIDDGKPFDPVKDAGEFDASVPLEERGEGGMGLFIVKKMMKSVSYRREGNRNIFTVSI